MQQKPFYFTQPVQVSILPLFNLLDLERTEGVYTNRAVAYIKLQKFKEALHDCEQALVINPKFAKAHVRAYNCYLQTGDL